MELLDRLLNQGDLVALDKGKLIIQPASGRVVPENWLKERPTGWSMDRDDTLAFTLAARAHIPLYKYIGYTVGSYANKNSRADGATLRFVNITTGEEVYAVYNIERNRIKDSAKGKAGSKLPGKQFRLKSENTALYKFWLRTGLAEPERKYLSEFHRVMGRLKTVYFTMRVSNGKADKNTIQAATVTSMRQCQSRGSLGEKTGEKVGISKGEITGNENPENPSATWFTDETRYVPVKARIKLTSREVSKDASLHSTRDIQGTLNTKLSFRYVPPHLQSPDEWLAEYNTGVRLTITCHDERWDQCA